MPEIKFFPETHVAYVSEIGAYDKAIQRGFERLFRWMRQKRVDPVGQSLAIFYDDPSKVAAANLHCDLCAPVGPDVTGSDEVQTKEIGGWKVATVVYQGEDNASDAYDQVYRWLREQGYHEADAPIEKYLSNLSEELRAEIAVPVIEKRFLPGNLKVTTAARSTRRPSTKISKKKAILSTTQSKKTRKRTVTPKRGHASARKSARES